MLVQPDVERDAGQRILLALVLADRFDRMGKKVFEQRQNLKGRAVSTVPPDSTSPRGNRMFDQETRPDTEMQNVEPRGRGQRAQALCRWNVVAISWI